MTTDMCLSIEFLTGPYKILSLYEYLICPLGILAKSKFINQLVASCLKKRFREEREREKKTIMLLQLSMVLIYNDDITNGLNLFQGKLNRMSTLFHENQDIQISFLIGHPLLKDDYKKLINNHERPTQHALQMYRAARMPICISPWGCKSVGINFLRQTG